MSEAFGDYRLFRSGPKDGLDAHFNGIELNCGGLYYLEYGDEVKITSRVLEDFYLIQWPVEGQAAVSVGAEDFLSNNSCASIIQPGQQVSLAIGRGARHLIFKINRGYLFDTARKRLDRALVNPVVFSAKMDLASPSNRIFAEILKLFVTTIDSASRPSAVATREFESLLVNQFLLGQPNNYSEELHQSARSMITRPIIQAAELIEAHAHESLTVNDIATAVDISPRALQAGFRRHYGTTPTAFLRDMRLQRVRTDLIEADPSTTTVAIIAMKWGFLHLGRFSVAYHHRFGEPPSRTLRLKSDSSAAAMMSDRYAPRRTA
ncbi:MAG TPA: AraC family transcriptional regulator [Sphingobium sp.]|nr:AraC family transcriptional regulator [Sphingobium sp.]